MRLDIPSCSIDWARPFSLPVCVPPEWLPDAARLQYVTTVGCTADNQLSTYGQFRSDAPNAQRVRTTPDAAGNLVLLPRLTLAPSADAVLPAAAATMVSGAAFRTDPPNPGTAGDVARQLESRMPYDKISQRSAPLPVPSPDFDSFRFYFRDQAPGFAAVLGLAEDGVFAATGLPRTDPPRTLLPTRAPATGVELGEVDRLLLRSPVAGAFRFEPYFHYRWKGATVEYVGRSNSGRLLVQQPYDKTRERDPADPTATEVFKERVFVLEHVDRASVVPIVNALLSFQVRFFEPMLNGFKGTAGIDARLVIPKGDPPLLLFVAAGVNNLLRAWVAFLTTLAWRPEDAAVAGALPAAWRTRFPDHPLKMAEAARTLDAVRQVLGTPAWFQSLLFFTAQVYSPLLAGYAWNEVLLRNSQDPGVRRFPVPNNLPPFSPKNASLAQQHQRLRLIDDPQYRWVASFAGSPVGKPSRVYAPAAGGATFPVGGLTTFELEALHVAGSAHTALGLGAPVATTGPQAGQAMDVSGYAASGRGYACAFRMLRSHPNQLYTTVDWLLELSRGGHFVKDEEGFVDLSNLMNPVDGAGHPLLPMLRVDERRRAVALRGQMDTLRGTAVAADSMTWWRAATHMPAATALSPSDPYRDDRTRRAAFPGVLAFEDLMLLTPTDRGVPSGFDAFDLESAYLAVARMSTAPGNRLPLAVLLAIMETEGIKFFGPINRIVSDTGDASRTLVWEALSRDPAYGVPRLRPTTVAPFPADIGPIARGLWLSWPYGLDRFALPPSDAAVNSRVGLLQAAGVCTLDPDDNVSAYIRKRVWAGPQLLPALGPDIGVIQIWKRSRRMHWAALALMAGFFRQLEIEFRGGTGGFAGSGLPNPTWLPAGASPPDLSTHTPTDTEWKDYLTYYAMVYMSYNSSPATLIGLMTGATAAHGASPLSMRDFLLFQHQRSHVVIVNAVRFMIALDAYLRLNYLETTAPGAYDTVAPNTTLSSTRAWVT